MSWRLLKLRKSTDFEITNAVYTVKIRKFDLFVWKVRLYKGKEKLLEKRFLIGLLAMFYVNKLMKEDIEHIADEEKKLKIEAQVYNEETVRLKLGLDSDAL